MDDSRARRPSTLPTAGSFEWARGQLAKYRRLSEEDLALVLEKNPGVPLPPDLLEAALKLLRRKQPRGRKPDKSDAAADFIIGDADSLYQEKLLEVQVEARILRAKARAARDKLPRADETPSERALQFVLTNMKEDLGDISLETLRNRLTLSRRCRYPKSSVAKARDDEW
jgi:hypothetical protein